MPNWCYSKFRFTGDKDQLKDFYNKVKYFISDEFKGIENDFGTSWLGNVLHGFEINDDKLNYRGDIYDITDNGDNVEICNYSAWNDNADMWSAIIEKHYDNICFVFISEEEGMGLYINTDIEGKYYKEKYVCRINIDNHAKIDNTNCIDLSVLNKPDETFYEVYFNNDEELIDTFNKMLGKEFDDVTKLLNFVDENFKYKNKVSISINPFISDGIVY